MGIRLKEDIRQCLLINALPKGLKKERIERASAEITRIKDEKENPSKSVSLNSR